MGKNCGSPPKIAEIVEKLRKLQTNSGKLRKLQKNCGNCGKIADRNPPLHTWPLVYIVIPFYNQPLTPYVDVSLQVLLMTFFVARKSHKKVDLVHLSMRVGIFFKKKTGLSACWRHQK